MKCEDCEDKCEEHESGLCGICRDEHSDAQADKDFEQGEHALDRLSNDTDSKVKKAFDIGWAIVLKGKE